MPGTEAKTTLRTRWYSVREAALLLNVSDVAIRKRLASGGLTGIRVGRTWRVLLPVAVIDEGGHVTTRTETIRRIGPTAAREDPAATTLGSMLELVRDLQRQNLELAGQLGYAQGQLEAMRGELKALQNGGPEHVVEPADIDEDSEDTTELMTGELPRPTPVPQRAEPESSAEELERLRRMVEIYQYDRDRRADDGLEEPPRRWWTFWRR